MIFFDCWKVSKHPAYRNYILLLFRYGIWTRGWKVRPMEQRLLRPCINVFALQRHCLGHAGDNQEYQILLLWFRWSNYYSRHAAGNHTGISISWTILVGLHTEKELIRPLHRNLLKWTDTVNLKWGLFRLFYRSNVLLTVTGLLKLVAIVKIQRFYSSHNRRTLSHKKAALVVCYLFNNTTHIWRIVLLNKQ